MGKKKAIKRLDYRHDKCKFCGNVKLKNSPMCRPCFNKKRKPSLSKKERKKLGKELRQRSENRIKQKQKYEKLRDEVLNLEKSVFPIYSYVMCLCNGEKYLRFTKDFYYPLPLVASIVEGCKKADMKDEKTQQVGMMLSIQNPFPKKNKKRKMKDAKPKPKPNKAKRRKH